MSQQENPIQTTNLRAVSRDLRGIKKRHPYTADSIDQAVKVLEFVDKQKREHGAKLLMQGLEIPLLPHRKALNFKPENGLYIDSERIKGLTFYINRKKEIIGLHDANCGILEIDFDRLPDFIAELLDLEYLYVDKED